MAESLGSAVLELTTDDSKLDAGLKRAEGKSAATAANFQKIGAGMRDVGAKLSLGLTMPIAAMAAASVGAAKESAEAMGQVEAALDSMGGASGRTKAQLAALAENQMSHSLYDDDEILRKVTANLLTFGNVSGAAFDQGQQAAIDMAARLGGDLQGATLMVGKALNDPIAGITALTRTGVQFTAQQKEQIKAMVEHGDRAGAQGIILGELKRQFGGAAQAMRDADPAAAMKQGFNTFQENIGGRILPLLPPLMAGLGGVLDAFGSLPPGVQTFTLGLLATGAAIGPALVGVGSLIGGVGRFLPLLMRLGPAWSGLLAILSGAGPVILTVGRALLGLLANPVLLGAAAVIAGIYLAWKNWDQIAAILTGVGGAMSAWWTENVAPILSAVADKVTAVANIFRDYFGAQVQNVVTAVAALLRGDFAAAWAAIVGFVGAPIRAVGTLIDTFVPGAVATFRQLYTGIKLWLQDKLGAVFDWVGDKVRQVAAAFQFLKHDTIGNSSVVDTADGIAHHFGRLDAEMVKPTLVAVAKVAEGFQKLKALSRDALGTGTGIETRPLDVIPVNDLKRPNPPSTDIVNPRGPAKGDHGGDYETDPVIPPDAEGDWREGARRAFKDGIRAALDGDLAGFFSNWLKDAATKALDAAVDILFDLLSGSGKGGAGGGIGAILSSVFAGGFAGGGLIPNGRIGLVGEEGPEIAIAGPRGTMIRPNSALSSYAMKAPAPSIHMPISIDATGADPAGLERVRAEVAGLRRDLPGLTIRTVQDAGERRLINPGTWR